MIDLATYLLMVIVVCGSCYFMLKAPIGNLLKSMLVSTIITTFLFTSLLIYEVKFTTPSTGVFQVIKSEYHKKTHIVSGKTSYYIQPYAELFLEGGLVCKTYDMGKWRSVMNKQKLEVEYHYTWAGKYCTKIK